MIRLSMLVMTGSALGGLGRYWLGIAVDRLTGPGFPWGTLLINVLGSAVIGAVAAATDAREDAAVRAFLMVGICGGFTTFSSFSLQTLDLLRTGATGRALVNVTVSVLLCIGAVAAGHVIASRLNGSAVQITENMVEEETS